MRVGGAWHYLYRGVDSNGDTLDSCSGPRATGMRAIAFFRKTVGASHTTPPRVVNVDKNPAYPIAFEAIKHEGFFRPRSSLRQCKYLNNVIEQDHRFIKRRTRPMLGFKQFTTAWRTVRGIEMMHALRKGQARWMAKGDVVGQTRLIPQGVRIGRVARSTQRTLARDPNVATEPLTGHKSRAIFDRYNIINEQELLDAGDQLVEYLAQQAQAVPARRRPHPAGPAAPRTASPLRLVTTRHRVKAHGPLRTGAWPGAAVAGHRPPVRRGSRTGHRCTNRPAIVAHAATGRADAAKHTHAPGLASGAGDGFAARSRQVRASHRLIRVPIETPACRCWE